MTSTRRFLLGVQLGTLLTGLLPTAAWAEGRLQKRELEVRGGERVEWSRSKPTAVEKPGGPAITVEDFVGRQQAKMQEINQRQVAQLERLIRISRDDDPMKPEYRFRLGELFAEKHRFFNAQARSRDEGLFRAEQAKDRRLVARLRLEQQASQQSAEQAQRQAIEQYVYATHFANYQRMDEVLFRLGYLLQISGREDKAREFFHRLVKDYPQSRYVANAYLSFAEYFFAKGEMSSALRFYE